MFPISTVSRTASRSRSGAEEAGQARASAPLAATAGPDAPPTSLRETKHTGAQQPIEPIEATASQRVSWHTLVGSRARAAPACSSTEEPGQVTPATGESCPIERAIQARNFKASKAFGPVIAAINDPLKVIPAVKAKACLTNQTPSITDVGGIFLRIGILRTSTGYRKSFRLTLPEPNVDLLADWLRHAPGEPNAPVLRALLANMWHFGSGSGARRIWGLVATHINQFQGTLPNETIIRGCGCLNWMPPCDEKNALVKALAKKAGTASESAFEEADILYAVSVVQSLPHSPPCRILAQSLGAWLNRCQSSSSNKNLIHDLRHGPSLMEPSPVKETLTQALRMSWEQPGLHAVALPTFDSGEGDAEAEPGAIKESADPEDGARAAFDTAWEARRVPDSGLTASYARFALKKNSAALLAFAHERQSTTTERLSFNDLAHLLSKLTQAQLQTLAETRRVGPGEEFGLALLAEWMQTAPGEPGEEAIHAMLSNLWKLGKGSGASQIWALLAGRINKFSSSLSITTFALGCGCFRWMPRTRLRKPLVDALAEKSSTVRPGELDAYTMSFAFLALQMLPDYPPCRALALALVKGYRNCPTVSRDIGLFKTISRTVKKLAPSELSDIVSTALPLLPPGPGMPSASIQMTPEGVAAATVHGAGRALTVTTALLTGSPAAADTSRLPPSTASLSALRQESATWNMQYDFSPVPAWTGLVSAPLYGLALPYPEGGAAADASEDSNSEVLRARLTPGQYPGQYPGSYRG